MLKLSWPRSGRSRACATACGLLLGVVGCNKVEPRAPDPSAANASAELQARAESDVGQSLASGELVEQPLPADSTPSASDAGRRATAGPATPADKSTSPSPGAAESEILSRPFFKLNPNPTTVPEEIVQHLQEIDLALQELVQAGMHNLLEESTYYEAGLRLGRMKLAAARRLAESDQATPEMRKAGLLSQLVALSHLSGLRDVESAKELERFAGELASSSDVDLAHQARVVQLGFEVQALQNGLTSDPSRLVSLAEGLLTRPEERNFPEFMAMQNALQVLQQMGYDQAGMRVKQILVTEYIASPDPQLRGDAWALATAGSQSVENLLAAMRPLDGAGIDVTAMAVAARGLVEEFPNATTLEQLAEVLTNVEYDGQIAASQRLAEVVRTHLAEVPGSPDQLDNLQSKLSAHEARVALIGQPLLLQGLVRFDGQPFSPEDYLGRVLLIDCWASWCAPCHRELPFIQDAYAKYAEQGFQVIGINMDENLTHAESYIRQQALPWTNLRAESTDALGFQSEFAKRLGVTAIPFLVLVGADGNVATIHVRGENLEPAIGELLRAAPGDRAAPGELE